MSATIEALKRTVAANMAALETLNVINQPREYKTPEERAEFRAVEHRADAVFAEFGMRTSALLEPRPAETPFEYRRRVAQRLGAETRKYSSRDIGSLPPEQFLPVEREIFADALEQSRHPLDLGPGQIREIKKNDGFKDFSEFRVGEGPGGFRAVYGDCIVKDMGVGVALNGQHVKIKTFMG